MIGAYIANVLQSAVMSGNARGNQTMILLGAGNRPSCGVIHNGAIIQQTALKARRTFAYIVRETGQFALIRCAKIGSESTA